MPGGSSATTTSGETPARRLGGGAGLAVMVAVSAVLAIGAFLLARSQATEPPTLLGVGKQAPAFSLTGDGGEPVSLTDEPGRPTVVAFVETGCSSCREEAPLLADLARAGAQVVAIDVSDSTPEERAAFARDDLGGVVPLASDPAGTVGLAYRALVVPTIYAVRADGTIADAWAGRVEPDRFARALAAAQ
jgi:cytochrome c biogenesis protein CcmG/thiol:disulfide interchange protein DsbE